MAKIFRSSDILLPKNREGEYGSAFAVIACDQFTGEVDFWNKYEDLIGDRVSALRLILPEVFLKQAEERIPCINKAMADYEKNDTELFANSLIYLRRKQPDGRIRCGIIGAIDLEYYDFSADSASLVRPTEKTVTERIPPRVEIRKNAPLELSHIMLLVDDKDCEVIEPLEKEYRSFDLLYDFELLQGAGHMEGYLIDKKHTDRIERLLSDFATKKHCQKLYGEGAEPLLFAVGDGNHSLATAKTIYENAKATYGKQALRMPCRYALAELVNLHSAALDFEPIYRTVVCPSAEIFELLKNRLAKEAKEANGSEMPYTLTLVSAKGEEQIDLPHPEKKLPVAFVQNVLDDFCAEYPECEIDYIHGDDSLRKLASAPNTLGILFEGMHKNDLFPAVMKDGVLPRKTFSMGHALDKRHYFEARKIK